MQCHKNLIFVAIIQVIYPTFAHHLEEAVESIQSIKSACGEICDVSKENLLPQSGPYFPYAWKNFECPSIFDKSWDQMGPLWKHPPRWKHLPSEIQKEFLWNGKFFLSDWYANDNWNISDHTWTNEVVQDFQNKYMHGSMDGNYGTKNVNRISK